MAKKTGGLGRGIDSIFVDNSVVQSNLITSLRLSEIEPRSDQPRKSFDGAALSSLADSISAHGVLQPIIVRLTANGTYEIVAGERRWRAAKLAGLSEIPVITVSPDDPSTALISIVENVQRENLSPYEEAAAYRALSDEYGLTQEQIAQKIGKSRSAVANMLRLLDLPEDVLSMLREGKLSAGHARALLALRYSEDAVTLARKAAEDGMSVRAVELAVKRLNKSRLHSESGEETAPAPLVDYIAELERKSTERLGRVVRIADKGKAKHVTISYENNEDLEDLLVKLCGSTLIDV